MKILIIEDEVKVASFIQRGLEEQGFIADLAYDGLIGKSIVLENRHDLIILDINIPGINGFDLCKSIKTNYPEKPILMLTALGTTDHKVQGFNCGADDYLVKPFDFRELLARIQALTKRYNYSKDLEPSLIIADLKLDMNTKKVYRTDKQISLTAKEFMLLEYFMRNQGKIISRTDIAEKVWKINFDTGTNVIDVYINFLRNKIDKGFSTKLIHTVVGMGYVMQVNDN